jgi:V8-like Glu-specific endopeptidase
MVYRNQIRFTCPTKKGDSGSLLMNKSKKKAIGLVFAKDGKSYGLANDIAKVFEKLEVTLACSKADN